MSCSSLKLSCEQVEVLWTTLCDEALTVNERELLQALLTEASSRSASGRVCSLSLSLSLHPPTLCHPLYSQYFDMAAAEHLYLNRMIHDGADSRGLSPAGYSCLESYALTVNAAHNIIHRTSDTDFESKVDPSAIQVAVGVSVRGCVCANL